MKHFDLQTIGKAEKGNEDQGRSDIKSVVETKGHFADIQCGKLSTLNFNIIRIMLPNV